MKKIKSILIIIVIIMMIYGIYKSEFFSEKTMNDLNGIPPDQNTDASEMIKEIEEMDENGDGFISLNEYWKHRK